jgi:hypothetical protein
MSGIDGTHALFLFVIVLVAEAREVEAAVQLEVAADGVAISVEESKDAAAIEKEIMAKEEAVKRAEAVMHKVLLRRDPPSLSTSPAVFPYYTLAPFPRFSPLPPLGHYIPNSSYTHTDAPRRQSQGRRKGDRCA